MYYIKVMHRLYNWHPYRPRYRHFESIEGAFYNQAHQYTIASCNGFAIDISKLQQDFRIIRFVRDPRDLLVSGYFYHKRGAEPWFRHVAPSQRYWQPINGNVPAGLSSAISYADYLNQLSVEDGLLAELEFRKHHFDSIRQWQSDKRIKVFKYEDILGNEAEVFEQIFDFYQLPVWQKKIGVYLAKKHAAGKRKGSSHIRNPAPGQWQHYFSPKVSEQFVSQYQDVLDILGY